MSNPYAGTQTEKNLEAAFAGESQARNKYTYFASVAKKEGYEQISALFLKTAENEKEHAKMWFKELKGIGSKPENLTAAADGEITNGPICTSPSPKPPRKRVSRNWPPSSAVLPPSKSITRNGTAPC